VLKTDKGDVQLFKPRVKKLMTNEEGLTEIDYAHSALDITQDMKNQIITKSQIVNSLDGKDVYHCNINDQDVYSFIGDDSIDALVILKGNELKGIRNFVNGPGYVTALIGCVTHRLKAVVKIQISKNEGLTPEGFTWLKKLILAKGRGLTLTDQTGDFPDINSLEKEWNEAAYEKAGPSEIFIESKMTRHLKTNKEMSENLMNTTWFIGDKNIL
jgi:hypothetical protein